MILNRENSAVVSYFVLQSRCSGGRGRSGQPLFTRHSALPSATHRHGSSDIRRNAVTHSDPRCNYGAQTFLSAALFKNQRRFCLTDLLREPTWLRAGTSALR